MASTTATPRKQPSRAVKTAGAMLGGVVEAVVLQPLDVLKVRPSNFVQIFPPPRLPLAPRTIFWPLFFLWS